MVTSFTMLWWALPPRCIEYCWVRRPKCRVPDPIMISIPATGETRLGLTCASWLLRGDGDRDAGHGRFVHAGEPQRRARRAQRQVPRLPSEDPGRLCHGIQSSGCPLPCRIGNNPNLGKHDGRARAVSWLCKYGSTSVGRFPLRRTSRPSHTAPFCL